MDELLMEMREKLLSAVSEQAEHKQIDSETTPDSGHCSPELIDLTSSNPTSDTNDKIQEAHSPSQSQSVKVQSLLEQVKLVVDSLIDTVCSDINLSINGVNVVPCSSLLSPSSIDHSDHYTIDDSPGSICDVCVTADLDEHSRLACSANSCDPASPAETIRQESSNTINECNESAGFFVRHDSSVQILPIQGPIKNEDDFHENVSLSLSIDNIDASEKAHMQMQENTDCEEEGDKSLASPIIQEIALTLSEEEETECDIIDGIMFMHFETERELNDYTKAHEHDRREDSVCTDLEPDCVSPTGKVRRVRRGRVGRPPKSIQSPTPVLNVRKGIRNARLSTASVISNDSDSLITPIRLPGKRGPKKKKRILEGQDNLDPSDSLSIASVPAEHIVSKDLFSSKRKGNTSKEQSNKKLIKSDNSSTQESNKELATQKNDKSTRNSLMDTFSSPDLNKYLHQNEPENLRSLCTNLTELEEIDNPINNCKENVHIKPLLPLSRPCRSTRTPKASTLINSYENTTTPTEPRVKGRRKKNADISIEEVIPKTSSPLSADESISFITQPIVRKRGRPRRSTIVRPPNTPQVSTRASASAVTPVTIKTTSSTKKKKAPLILTNQANEHCSHSPIHWNLFNSLAKGGCEKLEQQASKIVTDFALISMEASYARFALSTLNVPNCDKKKPTEFELITDSKLEPEAVIDESKPIKLPAKRKAPPLNSENDSGDSSFPVLKHSKREIRLPARYHSGGITSANWMLQIPQQQKAKHREKMKVKALARGGALRVEEPSALFTDCPKSPQISEPSIEESDQNKFINKNLKELEPITSPVISEISPANSIANNPLPSATTSSSINTFNSSSISSSISVSPSCSTPAKSYACTLVTISTSTASTSSSPCTSTTSANTKTAISDKVNDATPEFRTPAPVGTEIAQQPLLRRTYPTLTEQQIKQGLLKELYRGLFYSIHPDQRAFYARKQLKPRVNKIEVMSEASSLIQSLTQQDAKMALAKKMLDLWNRQLKKCLHKTVNCTVPLSAQEQESTTRLVISYREKILCAVDRIMSNVEDEKLGRPVRDELTLEDAYNLFEEQHNALVQVCDPTQNLTRKRVRKRTNIPSLDGTTVSLTSESSEVAVGYEQLQKANTSETNTQCYEGSKLVKRSNVRSANKGSPNKKQRKSQSLLQQPPRSSGISSNSNIHEPITTSSSSVIKLVPMMESGGSEGVVSANKLASAVPVASGSGGNLIVINKSQLPLSLGNAPAHVWMLSDKAATSSINANSLIRREEERKQILLFSKQSDLCSKTTKRARLSQTQNSKQAKESILSTSFNVSQMSKQVAPHTSIQSLTQTFMPASTNVINLPIPIFPIQMTSQPAYPTTQTRVITSSGGFITSAASAPIMSGSQSINSNHLMNYTAQANRPSISSIPTSSHSISCSEIDLQQGNGSIKQFPKILPKPMKMNAVALLSSAIQIIPTQSQNIGPSATGITSHMPTTQYREPSFVKITQHMLANQTRITNELKKSAALGRAPCSTPKT